MMLMRKSSLPSVAVLVVAAATVLCDPAIAGSSVLRLQTTIAPNGSGFVSATNSAGPWTWESCEPEMRLCHLIGRGRKIEAQDRDVGNLFRVRSQGLTGLSPVWRGRPVNVRPPSLWRLPSDELFVSPTPGVWRGGWEGEYSQVQVAVCAEQAISTCTPVTNTHYSRSCQIGSSFGLNSAQLTGLYLRVAEKRLGTESPIEPAYAVSSPTIGPVWPKDGSTAVAILNLLRPGDLPAGEECGPPAPGRGFVSPHGVAHAECQGGCLMRFEAVGQGRHLGLARMLSPRDPLTVPPMTTLQFPPPKVKGRLGAGGVKYVLRLDGRVVAKRSVPPAGFASANH
jgi:hypothetical protein